jgi:LDH2 family malate/lactate/ureidoglycolate dehydrogenase
MLAGSRTLIDDVADYGLFFLLLDPDVLTGSGDFAARIKQFKELIHATRPAPGTSTVRVPGEGSLQRRRQNTLAGVINIDDRVYGQILKLCA